MAELSEADRISLLNAIAGREGNAGQISRWYGIPVAKLRSFVADNGKELARIRSELEAAEEEQEKEPHIIPVADLDALWISKKVDRLQRMQRIADLLYDLLQKNPTDTTTLREFRSYLVAAANELGQLLHRGSGDSGAADTLNVDIQGVDMERLV